MSSLDRISNPAANHLQYAVATIPGIALGCAAFPLLVFLFFDGGVFSTGFWQQPLYLFAIWIVSAIFFAILGSATGLFSILLLNAFNWSLGRIFSPTVVISCSGGLTGFLLASPLLDGLQWKIDSSWLALVAQGPVLATLLGQTGSRLWEAELQRRKLPKPDYDGRFQFGTRSILALTVWCAVFVSIGPPLFGPGIGWAFLFWVILQGVLLCGATILDRLRGK